MPIIHIQLHNTLGCVTFFQTISAVVYNDDAIDRKAPDFVEKFTAHFGRGQWDKNTSTALHKIGTPFKSECCANEIILYSSKGTYQQFVEDYNKTFSSSDAHAESYHTCFKNCAHSVNFVLEYFFPKVEKFCTCGETNCCCGCPGLILSCFPPPRDMETPGYVFLKARKLKDEYGKPQLPVKATFVTRELKV